MPPEATPSPAEQAPQSLSPTEAASKIEALLTKEEQPDQEQQIEAQASEETAEADAPETPETTSKEVAAEGEEDEVVEPEAEPEETEELLIPVKLDGREVPLPVSEVANGYMRNKDYTQGKQRLAEAQRELEALKVQVLQEREVYGNLIPRFEKRLNELNPQEPDWPALLAHGQQTGDITQYWVAKAQWEEHSRWSKALQEEQGRLMQLQQLDVAEKLKTHLTQAKDWLVEKIPQWKDESRATADRQKIKAYAKDLGYSDQEIAHAYDPRMIVALRESMLYRELMANRPKPVQNVHQALRPGSTQGLPTAKATRVMKAKQRLAKTGRPDDAVAAIMEIIG